MKYMTTKVAITEWRASRALIDSVVQQFSSKWTPLGASDFTPLTIKNYRHKINVPITPDEINDSWLSHLYDESLTPEQMPITKFIVNELIIPKVAEDREMLLIANGVFTEFSSTRPLFFLLPVNFLSSGWSLPHGPLSTWLSSRWAKGSNFSFIPPG